MKAKLFAAIAACVIMTTLLFGNMAYALDTHAVIYIRMRVVGALSLNLEDGWVEQNLRDPKAEAFSELEERDIYVDRLQRNKSTIWLFTKTE